MEITNFIWAQFYMILYRKRLTFEKISATVIRMIQVYAYNIVFTLESKALFK